MNTLIAKEAYLDWRLMCGGILDGTRVVILVTDSLFSLFDRTV